MSADQYVAAVEARLTDLPWRVRKELVADLRVHLAEVPLGEDLAVRLGSPDTYAAELRTAVGLAPRRGLLAFLRARRPRNVAIILVLLAIAVVATTAVAWARSYQPLTTGSTSLGPNRSRTGAIDETVAMFRNGKPFQLGFSIANSGRFAVRIVDVPLDQGGLQPFKVRAYVVPPESYDVPAAVPFHPFTLQPRRERMIVLRGTYAHCDGFIAGSQIVVVQMPVRARFALWTHDLWIQLRSPLVISMPSTAVRRGVGLERC